MRQQELIATRLTTDELRKLDRLARRAGLSRSAALRAMLGAVDRIELQPEVIFTGNIDAVLTSHGTHGVNA